MDVYAQPLSRRIIVSNIKKQIGVGVCTAILVFAAAASFDAFAKKIKSRSFSSKPSSSFSFSSRSHSVSKPKKTSSYSYGSKKTSTKPKQVGTVNKVKTVSTSRSTTTNRSVTRTVAKTQRVATSKSAYQQQKQRFKKRDPIQTVATNGTTSSAGKSTVNRQSKLRQKYTKSTNPIVYQTRTTNRVTYIERRSRYYGSWDTPSYAYSGYSSYGMWDSIALWYMLDNIHNDHYRNMYYHQMNTPGMTAWRAEAEVLARDNAELRSKLRQMDQGAQQLQQQGVRRDDSYLPPGVDADILLAEEVLEATTPVLRMCTGSKDQNYYNVARILSNQVDSVNIEPIITNGSADNLQMIESGQCDAAIVQRDAYWNHVDINPTTTLDFERIFSPYSEVVHLVCNADSGVQSLSDLDSSHTLYVGESGSGSEVTWKNIVAEDSQYQDVNVQSVGGVFAKTRVANGDADCFLSVSGLKTQFMTDVNRLGASNNLDLVEWDDLDILDVTDPVGKPVYEEYTLTSDTYPNLQLDNWTRRLAVDTDSIIVPADIIVANNWSKQNKQTFEVFVSEAVNKTSVIQNYVGGQ